MRRKTSKKRNVAVIIAITAVFATFIVKLWNIQIVSAGEAKQAAGAYTGSLRGGKISTVLVAALSTLLGSGAVAAIMYFVM